jgi:dihydropyrimidinase
VTISQGKIVYQDGDVRTERGVGRYIDRPTHAPYYDAVQKRRELDAPSPVDRM